MAVTAINKNGVRPLLTDMLDNPFHISDDLFAIWTFAWSQYRGYQLATETFVYMKRLITGFLMITVEERQLLLTMNRIVSIIKIKHNYLWWFAI